MTIGERIKKRRLELELTADDIAIELGKSKATIYRYENGDIKNMPTTVLEPLAEILYTTPAYLMGWTDDPEDWERIANDNGVCPPNDYDGDPKDWYDMKAHAMEDHTREEAELVKNFVNDARFEQLAEAYNLLTPLNKGRVVNYTEKLLEVQRLEDDQQHILRAAHNDDADSREQQQLMQEDMEDMEKNW